MPETQEEAMGEREQADEARRLMRVVEQMTPKDRAELYEESLSMPSVCKRGQCIAPTVELLALVARHLDAALSKAEKERDEATAYGDMQKAVAQTQWERADCAEKERDELRVANATLTEALAAFFVEYDSGDEYAHCAPTDETERKMRAALTTNKAEGEGA
jgi:hypothetical protein